MKQHIIILSCWVVFILYWFVSAQSAKPTAERQTQAGMLAHRLPDWLGAVLFFVPDRFGVSPIQNVVAAMWLGAAFCILGTLVAILARRTLAGNWSNNVEFKEGHQLMNRDLIDLSGIPFIRAFF